MALQCAGRVLSQSSLPGVASAAKWRNHPGWRLQTGPSLALCGTAREQARWMSIDKYSLFGGDEAGLQRTSVDSYNKHGFVVNGVLIQGAVILLPESTLLWNVSSMQEITPDSLVVLRLLLNKPELCIIGTGRRLQRTPKALDSTMKDLGVPFDAMDTVNALATFNVLNEEGRNVVGVFLPLDPVEEQQSGLTLGNEGHARGEKSAVVSKNDDNRVPVT